VDGRRFIKDTLTGPQADAEALGRRLADLLLARGGREILAELYGRPL
jgi:hydroxymethylbilane synthase